MEKPPEGRKIKYRKIRRKLRERQVKNLDIIEIIRAIG
jgi:hypothetical protein